jgi:hypothetical protein
MTPGDIIRMAEQAGLPTAWISETGVLKWSGLERFAALVAAAEQPEPPPEPISDAKIRAEFRDIDRHTLPGDMTIEDWFRAGVRFAERQHEIV